MGAPSESACTFTPPGPESSTSIEETAKPEGTMALESAGCAALPGSAKPRISRALFDVFIVVGLLQPTIAAESTANRRMKGHIE
jgi:hypothetical protein